MTPAKSTHFSQQVQRLDRAANFGFTPSASGLAGQFFRSQQSMGSQGDRIGSLNVAGSAIVPPDGDRNGSSLEELDSRPKRSWLRVIGLLALASLAGTIAAPSLSVFESRSTPTPTAEVVAEPDFNLHVLSSPPAIKEALREPRHFRPVPTAELHAQMDRGPLLTNARVEPPPPAIPAPSTMPEPVAETPPQFVTVMDETMPTTPRAVEAAALPEQAPPPPFAALEMGPALNAQVEPMPTLQEDKPPENRLAWPEATALLAALEDLAEHEPLTKPWCDAVTHELELLSESESLQAPQAEAALKKLAELAPLAKEIATKRDTDLGRARVLRVYYAIARRLPVYNAIRTSSLRPERTPPTLPTQAEWDATLAAVNAPLQQHQIGAKWAKYLALSELRLMADASFKAESRRALAREVLRRMTSGQLTDNQLEYMRHPPFLKLAYQLMHWAYEPFDGTKLLENLEKHEESHLGSVGKTISEQYEIARWSLDPVEQAIGEQVNLHYRNANVRVACSGELLNRLLPAQQPKRDPVEDTIQGACVLGESATYTKVRMVLIPDPCSWRLSLEAYGHVDSSTSSSKGPATFWQDGKAEFIARKLLTVDRRNLRLYGAAAEADSDNHLTNFETEYDDIPLVGAIARSIAEQQYYDTQPAARKEVSEKVAGKAERQFNEAVDKRVDNARNEFRKKLVTPLRVLDLDPTAVDLQTTAERLIARYRVAGPDQLAANTPRPQAPADSLLSVQVHQSALNNAVQQLRMESQRFELRELYKELTELFLQKAMVPPEDLPTDVYVTFADKDALRVDTDQGRVRLSISLKELSHKDEHTWKSFTVRAYYVPAPDQTETNLVRDGVIELQGEKLKLGDQITLRGIFSKVLSRNRTISVINKQLAQIKQTADLQVSQFTVQDGWIGVALTYRPPGSPDTPLSPPTPKVESDSEPKDDDTDNTVRNRGNFGPTARPTTPLKPNSVRPR